MRLEIGEDVDRRHGARKLAEAIEDILRDKRNAFLELFGLLHGSAANLGRILPQPWSVRMKGSTRAEFALREGLDSCAHVL